MVSHLQIYKKKQHTTHPVGYDLIHNQLLLYPAQGFSSEPITDTQGLKVIMHQSI